VKSERTALLVLPATLFGAAVALAQIPSPTGNVYGTALDPEGKFVAGAEVVLAGPAAAKTTSTDAKGDFHFLELTPGSYSVSLERAGFETVRRDVEVAVGRDAVISISMTVAGQAETVTVEGSAASLDSRKIVTGASFSRKELDDIPTTRDPWAFLRQVPGVLLASVDVGNAKTGQQPAFVGKGSHPDQNTINLDGVGVSGLEGGSPIYFDFDSLDGVAVVTGGSDPSLSTPGVTLNLVTKRGTNRLRGSARVLYTDEARWDYGAEVGLPLWKDRLWFWGAGGANSYLTNTFHTLAEESVRYQEDQQYWNAKLSAEPAASNALTLFYVRWQRVADGRGAQFRDRSPETTWDNTFPAESFRIDDSEVFSEKLFASIDFSCLPADNFKTPHGGLETQADLDEDGVWQNSYYLWDVRSIRRQVGATASSFFATGGWNHELKFGFGYRRADRHSSTVWPGDQLIGLMPEPAIAGITRASDRRFQIQFYDAYLRDTLTSGRLTVSAGARFDYQRGRNLPSSVPANPAFPELLPAVRYGGDDGYPIAWRTVEPRVGASYALGKDSGTILRASYARFANQLGTEVASVNAFPGTAGLYYFWADGNGNRRVEPAEIVISNDDFYAVNFDPDNPSSSAPVNAIAKDLEPPTTEEFIVGIERQVFSDLSASAAYTHRTVRNLMFSPYLATTRASYRFVANAEGVAVQPSTGFALDFREPYYALVECPGPCVGTLLQNRPDAKETYDGVELQVVKRYSHGWMARASFAWNDWKQHIGPRAVVDPNNVTPGVNATGPVVEGGINATWQFNVGGAVELPLGLRAGVNFFGRQGFPTPYFIEAVTRDVLDSRPQIQIGGAADYRTPNVYILDLQLSRDFLIASRVAVGPVLDCFNVLGSRTVLSRDGFVGFYDAEQTPAFEPLDSFNRAVATLSGRTLRAGVRVSF
jgi:hypothetical protein